MSRRPPRFASADLSGALAYAAEVHEGQLRKGGDTPYYSHPLLVAAIAMEFGADLEQVQAALLHDVIEDGAGPGPEKRTRLRQAFGERVYEIVDLCTDSDVDGHPKDPWRPRKIAYLERLAVTTPDNKLVAAADKLSNVLTTLFDLRRHGSLAWDRFRQGREGMLWYYDECLKSLSAGETTPQLREVLAEFEARIVELKAFPI